MMSHSFVFKNGTQADGKIGCEMNKKCVTAKLSSQHLNYLFMACRLDHTGFIKIERRNYNFNYSAQFKKFLLLSTIYQHYNE